MDQGHRRDGDTLTGRATSDDPQGPIGGQGADAGRIVLIVISPRTAPGLLTWPAWQVLREADSVLAADPDPAWLQALAQAQITVRDLSTEGITDPALRAGTLLEAVGERGSVAWFGSPDGDPGLTDALAEHLSRRAVVGPPPEVELLGGSHDVPGARLLDLVAVMDRLRSPGGCPWDAEQTHATLVPYLLEETHEVLEAVESLDASAGGPGREHLLEELGDLLLQIVFHARIAQEHPQEPFGIDEVAAGIVAKLVRRHPHVFADVEVDGPEQVAMNWEEIKASEKRREGVFDGIPASLPALARAQKMLDRLHRAGAGAPTPTDSLEQALIDVIVLARSLNRDAEATLRGLLWRVSHG